MLLNELLQKNKKLHFTLIDPDKQPIEVSAERAKLSESYETDAIMVGGSTVSDKEVVYQTIDAIKKIGVKIPIILFPNRADTIPENTEYIFFMSLLNSLESKYVIGEQLKGAKIVKEWAIEPISMAYLIISTSEKTTTVESLVKLDKIEYDDIEKAANYAFVAENFWGFKSIYLEAGSGAEKPVPNDMVSEVRKTVSVPLIVGGGIRDGATAREKVDAGADIIVTGTLGEKNLERIKEIIAAIKS